jgi:predicted kinase
MTKTLTLLIGLPASGKSTWRAQNVIEQYVISSDDYIERAAVVKGQTYNEAFADNIDDATAFNNQLFQKLIREGESIVVDRTNLNPKSRRNWIAQARNKGYWIEGIVFQRPMTDSAHEEWNRRLVRPGKTIPDHVLVDMFCSFKQPTIEEGFDAINTLDTFKGF